MPLDFELTWTPSEARTKLLGDGLNRHAIGQLGNHGFRPVGIFVRDAGGNPVGGVTACLNWNWLQISLLWVDDALRGQGVGKGLMERIEAVGREKGCAHAHVDTFSFQARTFYESLGYEVFATLDDYPPGHARHYLRKDLQG